MKMKYRIRKEVGINKLLGRRDDGLYIQYFIDEKVLFGWEVMKRFLGYEREWWGFSTISEAKSVLKKHIELERALNENNKIVEVIDEKDV